MKAGEISWQNDYLHGRSYGVGRTDGEDHKEPGYSEEGREEGGETRGKEEEDPDQDWQNAEEVDIQYFL